MLIRSYKTNYYKNKFDNYKSNVKSTWKNISQLMKRNKKCDTKDLNFDCSCSNDGEYIADKLNNYFINALKKIILPNIYHISMTIHFCFRLHS